MKYKYHINFRLLVFRSTRLTKISNLCGYYLAYWVRNIKQSVLDVCMNGFVDSAIILHDNVELETIVKVFCKWSRSVIVLLMVRTWHINTCYEYFEKLS